MCRLLAQIGLHLLLNTFAIVTCIGAGGLSGQLGTAPSHLSVNSLTSPSLSSSSYTPPTPPLLPLSSPLPAGLYGVSVLLPGYDTLLISGGDVVNTTITNGTTVVPCILSQNSRLFPENIRTVIQPLDDFVPNCSQLAHYWTFLVANMSLCFLGLLLSVVAIFTNCATPCLEDRYQRKWSPQTDA